MRIERGAPLLALAAAVLTTLACSSKADNNPYLPLTGAGGTPAAASGTVVVAIVSPAKDAMESVDTLVAVTATVDIQGGTDFVEPSSVKVVMTANGNATVLSTSPLASTGGDTFAGSLSLGKVAAGSYLLTVSADSSGSAHGNASVAISVDAGPTVKVVSPIDGQAYSGGLDVEISADFGAAGPQANLSPNPSATLGGMPVVLALDPQTGTYRATIAFDPSTPPPAGVQTFPQLSGSQLFDVRATDANGVTAEKQVTFTIDDAGPTIAATTPGPGDVVGGVLLIQATITDPSGVLDSSVVAVIGDNDTPVFTLPLAAQTGGVYSTLFDTANLTACKPPPDTGLCLVYPTISFRASDSIGNQTVVGYDFAVDNVPPVADLDPPPEREMRLEPTGYECSFAFDPLGLDTGVGDMPNDGCMVPQIFDLRARVEDDGNRGNGLKVVPIAGVDPDRTNVYILSDLGGANQNAPLVVDSDGDGNCDEINPLLVPTSRPVASDEVLQIRLAGVPAGGEADFEPDPSLPARPGGAFFCGQGSATAPPRPLCTFEQPTVVFSYAGGLPSVWSVEPIDPGFRCVGNQFDALANQVADGQWICIAVETADKAGNRSVSAPIRVYVKYDDAGGFCAPPPSSAGPPPTCTGSFDPAANGGSGAATVGACRTRKFVGTEICLDGKC